MCVYTIIFQVFLPEIVSECVHPVHITMIAVGLSETAEVNVGLLPWCALL